MRRSAIASGETRTVLFLRIAQRFALALDRIGPSGDDRRAEVELLCCKTELGRHFPERLRKRSRLCRRGKMATAIIKKNSYGYVRLASSDD
jgi:hypothetical protein